ELAGSFRATQPNIHRDAPLPELGMSPPGNLRVGVFNRGNHAGDARTDDGVDTGRRLALMRAWLKRDVERRPLGILPGPLQRFGLGMGTPAGLRPAAAEDDAVLDDNGADRRIGSGTVEATA